MGIKEFVRSGRQLAFHDGKAAQLDRFEVRLYSPDSIIVALLQGKMLVRTKDLIGCRKWALVKKQKASHYETMGNCKYVEIIDLTEFLRYAY